MKTLLFVFLLFGALIGNTQDTVRFNDGSRIGLYFDTYITESGDTIDVGNTVRFGYPTNGHKYVFVMQGSDYCGTVLTNCFTTIESIRTGGYNEHPIVFAFIKGWGLIPISIDIEAAIHTGEAFFEINATHP